MRYTNLEVMKHLRIILNIFSGITMIFIAVLLLAELGFRLSEMSHPIITTFHKAIWIYFLFDIFCRIFLLKNISYIYKHPIDIISFSILSLFIGTANLLPISNVFVQLSLLGLILGRITHIRTLFKRLKFNPIQMLVLGFMLFSFIGSLLLSHPFALASGAEVRYLDALFTATSAICVTGLVTIDISTSFSLFGQIVILILIQLGGLGIMSFSAILSYFISRKLSPSESEMIQQSVSGKDSHETAHIIRSIFKYTFIFEAIGALFLYEYFRNDFASSWTAAYYSIFHSISAFCNAGFSLFSDSLIRYQSHAPIILIISGLIIIGGIGFPVLFNILKVMKTKKKLTALNIQSKLAILITVILIVVGTVLIYISEFKSASTIYSMKDQWLIAFFHSVSARTAGFNSIDITQFSPASIMVIILLMFIGASPGSTGGGIKTITLGVFIATMRSTLTSHDKIHIFNRKIPEIIGKKAIAIITIALITIPSFAFIILLTSTASLLPILFESVSAFSTVGLSLDTTSTLNKIGKMIIMIAMLTGRVGALTMAFAFTRKRQNLNYDYPEENVLLT